MLVDTIDYELAMKPPYPKRRGTLLHIKAEGKEAFGDIAPLPNWSRETLNEAKQELSRLIKKNFCFESSMPSVAFGVSSAFWQLQNPQPFQRTLVSSTLFSNHHKYAKIKLGHLSVEAAIQLIQKLPHLSLSVDINRKWSFDEALFFCQAFPPHRFRYIEEPVQSIAELSQLAKQTAHPFALDEHLRELSLEQIPQVAAWIIKPTLMGSIDKCLNYAKTAKKLGISCYLSSSFESGVGLMQIARLYQKETTLFQEPLGLDTYQLLEEDILKYPLHFEQGRITLPNQVVIRAY